MFHVVVSTPGRQDMTSLTNFASKSVLDIGLLATVASWKNPENRQKQKNR